MSAKIRTQSAVIRGSNPRKSALRRRQSAAPTPRQGLDAELSERAECARPEASAEALRA